MFNTALFQKTLRDSAGLVAAASVGTFLFAILFSWAMQNMGEELLDFLSRFQFLQKIMEVTFGIETDGEVSLGILLAVCFTHAVVLMLSGSVVVATSSRIAAGEVERGTADLLLTLPIPRSTILVSTTLAWGLAGIAVAICPLLGIGLATLLFDLADVRLNAYWPAVANLAALLLAMGGATTLAANLTFRRGLAIGWVVGVAVVSMAIHLVEPFLESLSAIRFLGLLNYLRPVDIVRSGEWPWSDISILLGIGAVAWLVGGALFLKRDIPTG